MQIGARKRKNIKIHEQRSQQGSLNRSTIAKKRGPEIDAKIDEFSTCSSNFASLFRAHFLMFFFCESFFEQREP